MKSNVLVFIGLLILFTLGFLILILGITPISALINFYRADMIPEMLLATIASFLLGFFQACLWYRIIEARLLKRKKS